MSCTCPTCGSELPKPLKPETLIANTQLTEIEQKIVHALLPEFGKPVTRSRLANRVFRVAQPRGKRQRTLAITYGLRSANQKLATRGLVILSEQGSPHAHRLTWISQQRQCNQCGEIYPPNTPRRRCQCGGMIVDVPLVQPTPESQAA